MARRRGRSAWRSLVKRYGVLGAARRYRRNPLYRRPAGSDMGGKYSGVKRAGYKTLRIHRGKHHGWKNNRRSLRRYRRNEMNDPATALTFGFEELTRPVTYTTALQYIGGATAALALPGLVMPYIKVENKGVVGYLANLASAAVVGGSVGMLLKDKAVAGRLFMGGLIGTGIRIVFEQLGPTLGLPRMGSLGADTDVQRAIDAAVRKELGLPVSDYPAAAVEDYPAAAVEGTESLPLEGDERLPLAGGIDYAAA